MRIMAWVKGSSWELGSGMISSSCLKLANVRSASCAEPQLVSAISASKPEFSSIQRRRSVLSCASSGRADRFCSWLRKSSAASRSSSFFRSSSSPTNWYLPLAGTVTLQVVSLIHSAHQSPAHRHWFMRRTPPTRSAHSCHHRAQPRPSRPPPGKTRNLGATTLQNFCPCPR